MFQLLSSYHFDPKKTAYEFSMVSDTMYSSHTMCINSCAKTFMSIFPCQLILLGMCCI